MNLSPLWIGTLERHGWKAVHWSEVGDARASDKTIMEWARTNRYIVFTHDLDMSAILAATGAKGPSVIQVRTQDVSPGHLERTIVLALQQHRAILDDGALITIDEARSRARILPLF